jgi:hypothetical protein
VGKFYAFCVRSAQRCRSSLVVERENEVALAMLMVFRPNKTGDPTVEAAAQRSHSFCVSSPAEPNHLKGHPLCESTTDV